MANLVEDLRKHSKYLYGDNVGECRCLMQQAAGEIERLRAIIDGVKVGAGALAPIPGLSAVHPAPHAAAPAMPSGNYRVIKAGEVTR